MNLGSGFDSGFDLVSAVGGAPGADCMGTIFPSEMPFFASCSGNKKYLPAATGTSPQMGEMAAVALPGGGTAGH